MKQILRILLAALIVTVVCASAEAQRQPPAGKPKWISDKGFWVVEGNIHNALENTIHFYNNDKVEIYKETISGVKLKLHKRKTLMKMKTVLETAVLAWQQNQPLDQNKKLLVASIQKGR
jgi:predicted pyridoxine 5'-phosphate oxidase superfamily flavin-nucleotide-binding protein